MRGIIALVSYKARNNAYSLKTVENKNLLIQETLTRVTLY